MINRWRVLIGLIIETWLANLLAQVLPVPLAFWLSAGLVMVAGLAVWAASGSILRDLSDIKIERLQWLAVIALIVIIP
jgi:hypothetical protein